MKDILLVDGYNIIGDWPELKELRDTDLAGARDRLIQKMAEYQAYNGWEIKIVFDAHMVEGVGGKYKDFLVDIIYTRENETADERIEKLVGELKNIETRVHVATSDYAEQSLTFGSGALRKSAPELRVEMGIVEQNITREVAKQTKPENMSNIPLSKEIAEIFDKWRRGDR
ncbi:putative RNA-binding protein with PIN domain [Salibacterium salarium]|uniref:NYN domain-containing protein n=1 Tax=Salibacterium salarium TaxID=284579 RepID=UPI0027833869|nr:NYN domain-containing protein [Salibacterium salarium]MDQ0300916.1 putative RNA-binding protein with PIN domain [Salibacterium salarium]